MANEKPQPEKLDQGKNQPQPTPSPKIQHKPAIPTPRQSQVDKERADWEGMGQPQHDPKED